MYAAAIQNRLRADNNLSDVKDKAAARRNLGIDSSSSSSSGTDTSSILSDAKEYTDDAIDDIEADIAKINRTLTAIQTALLTNGIVVSTTS